MRKATLAVCGLSTILSVSPLPAQTRRALTEEACREAEALDHQVAELFAEARRRAGLSTPSAAESFEATQVAWESFRSAEVALQYPDELLHQQDSVRPMCVCLLRGDLARQRLAQLRRLIEWTEGDVCAPNVLASGTAMDGS